jgi:hypothetical protein
LFPDRTRTQIRNKFKKEEKENNKEIEWALNHRLPLDVDAVAKGIATKPEDPKDRFDSDTEKPDKAIVSKKKGNSTKKAKVAEDTVAEQPLESTPEQHMTKEDKFRAIEAYVQAEMEEEVLRKPKMPAQQAEPEDEVIVNTCVPASTIESDVESYGKVDEDEAQQEIEEEVEEDDGTTIKAYIHSSDENEEDEYLDNASYEPSTEDYDDPFSM